jgi:hypothetical protein
MKIVVLTVRLLGLVFLVFGLNAFLQFFKGPLYPAASPDSFFRLYSSRTMRGMSCLRRISSNTSVAGRVRP